MGFTPAPRYGAVPDRNGLAEAEVDPARSERGVPRVVSGRATAGLPRRDHLLLAVCRRQLRAAARPCARQSRRCAGWLTSGSRSGTLTTSPCAHRSSCTRTRRSPPTTSFSTRACRHSTTSECGGRSISRSIAWLSQTGSGRAFTPTCQILPPNLPGYEPTCPYARDGEPRLDAARKLVRSSGTTGAQVTVRVPTFAAERDGT